MKVSQSSLSIGQKILLFGVGSISIITLSVFYSVWRTGDRFITAVTGLFQLESVFAPVETPTSIVQKIQEIQELTTTIYSMETIVPTSADRRWGDFSLGKTKLLYIGHGEVRAGIDLSQLAVEDIQINRDRILIELPPAQILDSKVDVNRSRVYDYDRGFLNLGPDVAPQLQTLAQRKTLAEIVNNACREGILETANQKAKTTIAQLLASSPDKPLTIQTSIADCPKVN
ncbi:MAG: DUF4230 domain-containing protein [Pleurocapsa sp.]